MTMKQREHKLGWKSQAQKWKSLGKLFLVYYRKHLKQKDVFWYAMKLWHVLCIL
jgi:hypothetical protein